MMLNVILQNELINLNVPTNEQFQRWVNTVFQHINNHLPKNSKEVCIRIVDKTESAELNKRFRQKNRATNVLSFPNDINEDLDNESLGDIAICADIVETEADEQQIPLEHHWAHLVIHGILHLLGYDHINENDAIEMENLEIRILNTLNIENPYPEFSDDAD